MYSGPNNRKRLLVNPKFQLTILGYMLGFSIVITAVMLTSAYYYHQGSVGEGLAIGYESDHIFFEYLKMQYHELNVVIISAALVSTLVLMFGGLYLSNKIVGPISRFKNELHRMGDSGVVHEINFRKGDYFPDLAETFNQEIQRLIKKQANKGQRT